MSNVRFSILRCAGVAGMAAICLVIPVRARGEPASAAGGNPPTPGGNYAAGESKDVVDSTIGFFEDGKPTEVAELETLPEDPFFDRYVPLEGLAAAWEAADSQELAALAIQAAEAERILLRSRHGLPTDVIWRAAIRVAHTRADKESLQRLARASKRLGKKEYRKPLEAALALAGTSRAADEAIAVNPLKMTEQEYAVLQAYSGSLTAAAARGDKRYLRDFEHNLEALFPGAPGLKGVLKRLLEYLIKSMPTKPLDPQATAQLNSLLADSRFGGIKIGGSVGKWTESAKKTLKTGKVGGSLGQLGESVKKAVKTGKVGGDVGKIWEDVKKPIKIRKTETINLRTPPPSEERRRLAAQWTGQRVYNIYRNYFMRAARQRTRPIRLTPSSPHCQRLSQAGFNLSAMNVGKVEWYFGVPVPGEARAATLGNQVLVRQNYNPGDPRQTGLVLHELVHAYQVAQMPGGERGLGQAFDAIAAPIRDYVLQGGTVTEEKVIELVQEFTLHQTPLEKDAQAAENEFLSWLQSGRIYVGSSGQNYSLVGTWRTEGRTVTFDGTYARIQTVQGNKTFQYSYDPSSGQLVGIDQSGARTNTQVRWQSQNSFEWISPSGHRHYVRVNN